MPKRKGLNHIDTLAAAAIIFFVILIFLLVLKEYFNIDDLSLNPFAAVLLIGVIGAVSLSISYCIGHQARSWKEAGDEIVKKFIKMEEKNTGSSNIKILGDANYYGGHKKYAEQAKVTIVLLENGWILTREISRGKAVRIRIDPNTIHDFGIATKKQLTISRFLMVGILAFALKKKKKYLYIKYTDHLGFENNPVFDFMPSEISIEEFSNTLYDVLEKRQKK